ncbi:MAG: methylmalonyl-CoA mutase [Candidatus Marinimicrobia bacterium]|nr:methylmalonyl-CoA mutase [Candidatus Neomarinimicrobiota bacterium]|tara:strand:+ start:20878 stop:22518 length:1641 start_codon:yes stop_codon:yes gene_type:complete
MKNNSYNKWKEKSQSSKTRDYDFNTISDKTLDILYHPDSVSDEFLNKVNYPGEFPYTRGIHANMYRGKLWTMRQFSGFGSPEDTNNRYKFLLNNGQTGLSVAFDMPTLMGYDADDELSDGEVGHCGVSISSLDDMEMLFKDIDLDKISVSMTINGPAVIIFAFYVALAIKRGLDISKLNGTLQNDILKEYIAQKEWIYPPKESIRLIVDMIEYCTSKMPKYNTISVSGYHIREAGSTAVQELAFTLSNGFAYLDACIDRGMKVDQVAPRLSFFFNSHSDFFEEICKYRAARRIWSKKLKEYYNAKDEKSMKLRFHTQTAGFSLTAQQPEINIARTSFQALSAVLGGTQSLHTNSMDETLALPSEKAAEIALRTQQILAYETGVANVVDPLGGSYYVEELTDNIEKEANEYFEKIESIGGVVNGIESGYFQKEIADSSSMYNDKIEKKERYIVGVNKFIKEDENIEIPILEITDKVQVKQINKLNKIKSSRNNKAVSEKLERITKSCNGTDNLLPLIIDAALEYATLGEIVNAMKTVFGEWNEQSII